MSFKGGSHFIEQVVGKSEGICFDLQMQKTYAKEVRLIHNKAAWSRRCMSSDIMLWNNRIRIRIRF